MDALHSIPAVAGIYAIVNTVNGRQYIGSAVNLKARLKHHRTMLRVGRHVNPKLQNAWNKYGESSFKFELIKTGMPVNQLPALEQQHIDAALSSGLYNLVLNLALSTGKRGRLGKPLSEEARRKRSESQKGRTVSEETRQRLREAWTLEAKARMSLLSNAYTHTPETIEKLKNRKFSDEHKAKLSKAHQGMVYDQASREKRKETCRKKREQKEQEEKEWQRILNATPYDHL